MRLLDLLPYAVVVPPSILFGNLWGRVRLLEERVTTCFDMMQRAAATTQESAKLLRVMREEVRQLVDDEGHDDDEDE